MEREKIIIPVSKETRTIGLYQPFTTLMLHDKDETRWVKKGKKPPFPLGNYVIYSTLKRYDLADIHNISGPVIAERMNEVMKDDPTCSLWGYAIAHGTLVEVRPMRPEDSDKCYVLYQEKEDKTLWCLIFENVTRIEPIKFKGKQGVGFWKDYAPIIAIPNTADHPPPP